MLFFIFLIFNLSFLDSFAICEVIEESSEQNRFLGKSVQERLALNPDSIQDFFDTGYPMTYEKFDEILKKNNINKIIFNLTVPRSGTWLLESIMKKMPGLENFNPNLVQLLKFYEFSDEYKDSNFDFGQYFDLLLRNRFNKGIFILGGHFEASVLFLETLFRKECFNDNRWYILYQFRQNQIIHDLSMFNAREYGIWHQREGQKETAISVNPNYNPRNQLDETQYRDLDIKLHYEFLNRIFHNFERASILNIYYEALVSEPFCIIRLILEDVGYTGVLDNEIEFAVENSLSRNKVSGKSRQITELLKLEAKRSILKVLFHDLVSAQGRIEHAPLPISCLESFQILLNATNYFSGFSHEEEWGRWITEEIAVLKIDSEVLNTSHTKNIVFLLNGYVPFDSSVVKFNLIVNSLHMGQYRFDSNQRKCKLGIIVPKEFSNSLVIEFMVQGLSSPLNLGLSQDPRTLGITVDKNVKIHNLEDDIRGISVRFS